MQEAKIEAVSDNRISCLKRQVQEYDRGICSERALLWTEYFKNKANRKKPIIVQMAEALRHVLTNKSVTIYPDELIVGNFTSLRVGGIIYPELHGVPVMLDLFKYPKRTVNPLRISRHEQFKLAMTLPFWQNRFLVAKAFPNLWTRARYSIEQLQAKDYYIYEAGGIAHLAPDHEKLIRMGVDEIKKEIEQFRVNHKNPDQDSFYEAALIAAEALASFGGRYAECAQKLADEEKDRTRRAKLLDIAKVCRNVPRHGANTFHGINQRRRSAAIHAVLRRHARWECFTAEKTSSRSVQ
jgi:formate C-acetyltransferase